MSSVRISPVSISGPFFHQVALSIRTKSRTTSQSRFGHAEPLHPRVGRADGRVLAEEEVALADAVQLREDRLVRAVAAGQPWQVVVAEVTLGRRASIPTTPSAG